MCNKYFKFFLSIAICSFFYIRSHSQIVYEHVSNQGIYEFIDEMANADIITINDVIKPYSKIKIFNYLQEIESKLDYGLAKLNKRQIAELHFYLETYILENESVLLSKTNIPNLPIGKINPLGIFVKNDEVKIGFQPIWGGEISTNKNGSYTASYGGAAMYGYIGDNLGFYGNVRDNNISKELISTSFLSQRQSAPYKVYGESIDFSETRGGLIYSWKWGHIGIVKDHIQWGTGYNGTNILSGKGPSFAMIKLNLKPTDWFEFNYFHGWLNSIVIDSVNSYWTNGTYRPVQRAKYIAANMFTFYPLKKFNISIGNSIIYSDLEGINGNYLIPFLFFKSVDHTINSTYINGETGQNAQMFINFSSRTIKNLHLYFTLYADDLSFTHFTKKNEHNFFSYKLGGRLINFPIENINLTFEFTHTNPLVFQHKIETQTFENSGFNLGHYLKDNARELYIAISYKPIRGLYIEGSLIKALKGDNPTYAECANDPDCGLHTIPILDPIRWRNNTVNLRARYEILANIYSSIGLKYSNIEGDVQTYTPEYYYGETLSFFFSLNIGF